MIRYEHNGVVGPATVRAVVHTGISITAHGKPARLAILGEDGSVIAEGQAVADAVEAAADARWRKLADGVDKLDFEARMQARQLVADTFVRLTVWRKGIRPGLTPKGEIHVQLSSRAGVERMIQVSPTGGWAAMVEILSDS